MPTIAAAIMVPIQWRGVPVEVHAKMKRPIGKHGAVYNSHQSRDSYCAVSSSGLFCRSLMLRLIAGMNDSHARKYPIPMGMNVRPISMVVKFHCLYTMAKDWMNMKISASEKPESRDSVSTIGSVRNILKGRIHVIRISLAENRSQKGTSSF